MFDVFQNPIEILYMIPGVIIGFTIHEFGHAWSASLFGDDTARLLGRVTLNPAAHLDPLGTILLVVGGFGWAKPVPVNVYRLRPRILGDIVVSLAGVTLNFLMALLFFLLAILAYTGYFGIANDGLNNILWETYRINLILVGFNLLPIPPLDGFRVAKYLLPASMDHVVESLYRFGPMLLILFFLSGFGGRVLGPIYGALQTAVETIMGPLVRLLLA